MSTFFKPRARSFRMNHLGLHGSPESYQKYAEFLGRLNAGELDTRSVEAKEPPAVRTPLVMAELVDLFDVHCEAYYRRDGEPTGEHVTFRAALRPIVTLFSALPVSEFSPRRLVAVRDEMIRLDWSRRHINASVRRIRQMFRWAVAQEIVSSGVASALAAVEGLKEGRSAAREKDLPGPVADGIVEATLPHVSAVAADVIRLMQHSGMRPAEAVGMKVEAIDRSDPECWLYRPRRHKTSGRGKSRVVFLGSRCQEILSRHILKAGSAGRVFLITLSGQFPEIILGGIRVFCSYRFPVTRIGGPLAGRG
jgi:integrase